MNEQEVKELKLGVYRLYWVEGGTSVACVGQTYSGNKWYAPSNWTTSDQGHLTIVGKDWDKIEKVELITVT